MAYGVVPLRRLGMVSCNLDAGLSCRLFLPSTSQNKTVGRSGSLPLFSVLHRIAQLCVSRVDDILHGYSGASAPTPSLLRQLLSAAGLCVSRHLSNHGAERLFSSILLYPSDLSGQLRALAFSASGRPSDRSEEAALESHVAHRVE
ncbi:hypothetical protein CDD83_1882 [Cordyceps sp. RAO-2017]|nr:hypothetical protein CDD83_1882 [Cordyceps sp. RAO-2017]